MHLQKSLESQIRQIGFVGLCVTVLLHGVTTAHAQSTESAGLSLTPPTFEIAANPGDTVTNSVKVDNLGQKPLRLAVDRRNFTAIGEDGSVGITESDTGFSLASWLTVSPTEYLLPSGSSQVFTFTLKVPLNAAPGGHFGSLIFRTIPTDPLVGSGASLAQELGSLILVKVAGQIEEAARIESFAPTHNFAESGPTDLELRVQNFGNVQLKPTGSVTITNALGQSVAELPLLSKNVLPGSIRKFVITWDRRWTLGRYTATVFLSYGSPPTQLTSVTTFIVFPYRLALATLIPLLLLCTLLFRARKRLRRALHVLLTGKG